LIAGSKKPGPEVEAPDPGGIGCSIATTKAQLK